MPVADDDSTTRWVRERLAQIEAAQLRASSSPGADRLYEKMLRYRRLAAFLENRAHVAALVHGSRAESD